MVAPPASNVREYKASARADGGWVRGRTVRRKREDSLRKIRILRDQYGHTKEGAVLKTLRFSKLVGEWLRACPDRRREHSRKRSEMLRRPNTWAALMSTLKQEQLISPTSPGGQSTATRLRLLSTKR